MKKNISVFLFSVFLFCYSPGAKSQPITTGNWLGDLHLNDSTTLTFRFVLKTISGKSTLEIINGAERIIVDEISFAGDSVFIKMPVFDSEFRCINKKNSLKGVWINHGRKEKNIIPFSGKNYPENSEQTKEENSYSFFFRGEATFSPGTPDEYKSVAVFNQKGNRITGTFLTETGDYRFLQGGVWEGHDISLTCFDGSHAFLFTGQFTQSGDIVNGHFYSGAHWHEPWVAKRNDKFELRNPDSLTYLIKGFEKIDFSFPNLEGKTVSLSDEKFKNKVVVVQIMGSWCPNCLDETKFFAEIYPKYKNRGLEIVAVSFEKTETSATLSDRFTKAASNVSRLKNRFNANYEFLIADKPASTKNASESFPMLNGIMSFPTTIFIDKKGRVRKIHTGFSGPATGIYYDRWKEQTELFLEKLLSE